MPLRPTTTGARCRRRRRPAPRNRSGAGGHGSPRQIPRSALPTSPRSTGHREHLTRPQLHALRNCRREEPLLQAKASVRPAASLRWSPDQAVWVGEPSFPSDRWKEPSRRPRRRHVRTPSCKGPGGSFRSRTPASPRPCPEARWGSRRSLLEGHPGTRRRSPLPELWSNTRSQPPLGLSWGCSTIFRREALTQRGAPDLEPCDAQSAGPSSTVRAGQPTRSPFLVQPPVEKCLFGSGRGRLLRRSRARKSWCAIRSGPREPDLDRWAALEVGCDFTVDNEWCPSARTPFRARGSPGPISGMVC